MKLGSARKTEESRQVLVRLGKSERVRAGCLVILAYLFCVLAPSVALALGAPFPCLTDDIQPGATVHVHMHGAPGAAAQSGSAGHDHHGMHAHHTADAAPMTKHDHDGKGSPGSCCALMCVSAMPADLPSVTGPLHPIATRVSEAYRALRSETPALHYRPPIA